MSTLITTELRCSDSTDCEYTWCEEELKERARELILENTILTPWHNEVDTLAKSVTYSLGYGQGDGVSFRDGSIPGYCIATNSYSNYYSHAKTFEVVTQLIDYDDEGESIYGDNDKAKEYTEELREICYKLESIGYKHIEEENKEEIKLQAFKRFKAINNISSELEYYDFSEGEGTLIATPGDTNMQPLYIQLPEIKTLTRQVEYNTFI